MPVSGEKHMSYFRVNEKCNGCLACVQNCPADALDSTDVGDHRTLRHNMARCARCGNCWRVCPEDAIEFQHLLENKWDEIASLTLAHCSVCGEILYTTRFGETVSVKLDRTIKPLCPRHRESVASLARAHFFSGGKRPKEVQR